MIEVRAADLRFTEAEATQFLQKTMGLTLTPDQVAALEARTEGWVAGLQMAALSMQNRTGIDDFVTSLTGSHRFIMDYLIEEALNQQPEPIRTFLLATAMLNRLSGPLCEAVTDQEGGQRTLEKLEQDNLFVVPLDDERRWYRYHHLFAEVLQAHAVANYPKQITIWHQRASKWFAQHGAPLDAIEHAFAANDFHQAAGLMEVVRPTIDCVYQLNLWLRWAKLLPISLIYTRPVLSMGYAWALIETGRFSDSEPYMQSVESLLKAPSANMVVTDEEQWRTLPASLAAARAYVALTLNDVAETISQAQTIIDFFGNETHHWQGVALSLLGLTSWINGNLESSIQAFANQAKSMLEAGRQVDAISVAYSLAEMQIAQGDLNQAAQTVEQTLVIATHPGETPLIGTSDLYRVQAYLTWERGDLDSAKQQLQLAKDLGEQAAITNWHYRFYLTQAQLKQSQGDLAAALTLLANAEGVYVETPIPMTRHIAALKANIWIAQGDLDKARGWVQAQQLSTTDELNYLREFDYITLARVLLATYQQTRESQVCNSAALLLTRLLATAQADNRKGSMLDILTLQALLYTAQDDIQAALIPLDSALTLAEPHGYVRRFVDKGPIMMILLQAAHQAGIASAYVNRLLAEFGEGGRDAPHRHRLIEPLSERELEILTLIVAGLKNKEIAEQLYISLNTVLYHIKNIYSKLGVNKRALAIAKATELNLL